MRFIGIDIGSEKHFYAVVDEGGQIVSKSTSFMEDDVGHAKLIAALGSAENALVAMEATGHYWQNLFAALTAAGFAIALLNPLRTSRFAAEDLRRTKTDAIDALGIARFAQQKRPAATKLTDEATLELRELVRHRDRLVQQLGDHVRQLHRLVDLGFPELTRLIKDLSSALATTVLAKCPTARAFGEVTEGELANMLSQLMVAGHETTTSLIANLVFRLLERRERWEQLCADPSLVELAVEESDALIRILCQMADRVYPLLRALLSRQEPAEITHQRWQLFAERLTDLVLERMNPRRSGVQLLLDPHEGQGLRRSLVRTLSLAAGPGGFERLRASLHDAVA